MSSTNRLSRKEPSTMGDVVHEYVRLMKISAGLNRQLVFDAWDAVSGVAEYTVGKYLKDGVLYCAMSSSVVRSRIFPRREELVKKINEYLREDELFVPDDPHTGYVRQIVLK